LPRIEKFEPPADTAVKIDPGLKQMSQSGGNERFAEQKLLVQKAAFHDNNTKPFVSASSGRLQRWKHKKRSRPYRYHPYVGHCFACLQQGHKIDDCHMAEAGEYCFTGHG
jgi:hypothetical protein